MKGLEEKVIVVAGGATGIGAATARRLASEGARVMIGDIALEGAEETAEGIVAAGHEAEAFEFDLSDEQSCAALIAAATERWQALHGIFNVGADLSSANLGRDTDVVTVPLDVLERTLRVNLMGYFFTSRHAIPALLEAGGGGIVHTTSGVVQGLPEYCAYGASKGGIIALSRHIAARWGKEGVRSNALDPGITLTENQLEMNNDEHRAEAMRTVRAAEFGKPEEIAATVAFLLSDEAPWINGQTLPINSSKEPAR